MSGLSTLYLWLAVILLANLVAGLVRIVRGPTLFDRMIAGQLSATLGVGVLLLLAKSLSRPALADVAFVLAILAPVTTLAFVRASQHLERPKP